MLNLLGKENIIFDLGGVLLNIDYSLTERAFIELGLSSFQEMYSQQKQSGLFDRFETGKISKEEFVYRMKRHLPNSTNEDITNAWNAMLLDLPFQRLDLLDKLAANYRIFLLSNTNQIHEEAFLTIIEKAYGENVLFDKFEDVYLSHRIGLRKPNADCFLHVLDSNDLNATKTIFIDDSIQHIGGAREAGIEAFHLPKGVDITQVFPDKFQPILR